MTQNKRNERKKTKDFPRGWTVCAYPCLHPLPSHQQCVWRQFRGTEKTYRDHVVKSIQFSNIYLLLQVEHMWLSGLNSYALLVYPPIISCSCHELRKSFGIQLGNGQLFTELMMSWRILRSVSSLGPSNAAVPLWSCEVFSDI